MDNLEKARDRAAVLRNLLNKWNHHYYLLDQSLVSDKEFDQHLKELQAIETTFPELHTPDSPTLRVGGAITKNFPTVRHTYPMLSLDNSYNMEDLSAWDSRVQKDLERQPQYMAELKYDGVALSLTYEKGVLTRAVTRGDGTKGDDITANARTIQTIPLRIQTTDLPDLFEVRGEAFMPKQSFEQINKNIREENEDREREGKKPINLLANPRNAASGTLKMQDSSVVAARKLDCYLYTLLGDSTQLPDKHSERLDLMRSWGFNVPDHSKLCSSIEEVSEYIHSWETKRAVLPLATDGVVVKVDSHTDQEILGATSKSPRWAMSYKYAAESALTRLVSVDFQVGRTGAVTPVANLEPVHLAGTTVKRATLHNADEIERLGLKINDFVFVEKAGEIIPKITGVQLSDRPENVKDILFPTECPACTSLLIRPDGEVAYYCPNQTACPPQIKGEIEHFIQRKAMDIGSIGPETIELFLENGLITNVADLYTLTKPQILGLDRFKDKSAENILQGLEKSKEVPFERVLFGLGIRFVGSTTAKKLAAEFGSIEKIQEATLDQLVATPEVGQKIAESVLSYFGNPSNLQILARLQQTGLQMKAEKQREPVSTVLDGKTFVVSGVFQKFSRDELKAIIEENGGKVVSSISKKLSYLIAGDKMGPSKREKAENLGIEILSEEEFSNLIER